MADLPLAGPAAGTTDATAAVRPARTAPPRRPTRSWSLWFWTRALPPALGIALVIFVWSALTGPGSAIPSPTETARSAAELFAHPFYDNGPNDMGIGWNILASLQRVGAGFGLAALVWCFKNKLN